MAESVNFLPISAANIVDRLRLCWGHLNGWTDLGIVHASKRWLESANTHFSPTTFIAYKSETAVGMIESVPQKLLKLGLCPCRIDAKSGEIESRYLLGDEYENHLFISCLSVDKESQGKGVGKALLRHFLRSKAFAEAGGATVYVRERDESWDKFIHWPAGPKEFYLKAGFIIKKTLANPTGYLLCYSSTE